jgi:uncharacterized membrane protein
MARVLFAVAAIGALLVLGAHVVAPPISATAAVRTLIDVVRFVGPPLTLVVGLVALVHARRLERAASATGEAADVVFRTLVIVAVSIMMVGLLTGVWSALVLTVGALLR